MRIMVDIAHPAHVNFFKNALLALAEEGHEIIITGLRRGKLPQILANELSQFSIHYVGKHRGTKWSIILEANLLKAVQLFFIVLKKRPDVGLSVGSFILGGILKLFGKPNVQFDDDPERPVNVWLEKRTSTRLFFPPIVAADKHVSVMHALKEWAYLSPQYFRPNEGVLTPYGLVADQYFLVREVSTGSLNYAHQAANTVASFADQLPEYPVLLSLEDKSAAGFYPPDWILLQEPIPDIHSLLYFSRLIISSGDSMAREGALLGVPSVYVGTREMKANALLKEKDMLFHCPTTEAAALVGQIVAGGRPVPDQSKFRAQLNEAWDDITGLIVEQVHQLADTKKAFKYK